MSPLSFWTSLVQGGAVATSAILLSAQRIYDHRRIDTSDYSTSHTKHYKTRDLTVPFSDGTRLNRLLFSTAILTLICTTILVLDVQQLQKEPGQADLVFRTIGGAVSLVCWLYYLVLSVVSRGYPLPDRWGWILNIHLSILFFVTLMTSIGVLIDTLWHQPNIPIGQAIPFVLMVLLGCDLVYATASATNGPPFLDENGKRVIDINEASLISRIFFNWMNPIARAASTKGGELSNDDLPMIPSTHRSYNLFYIFGKFRKHKKSLFYRIIRANWVAIVFQVILAIIVAIVYYIAPYFLNKFLELIQNDDNRDTRFLVIAFGYVCAMSIGNIFVQLVSAQLNYFGNASAYLRIGAMLNVEIYQKTLLRADTSIASGKKKQQEQVEDNNKDTKEEESNNEEEETSSGKIVNLMSTDTNCLCRFSAWWFVIIQAPGELITGVYLLYSFLGWSSILGLVPMFVSLPINHFASKFFARSQEKLMHARDKRVSLMNELLQGIRQIKFFAWEGNWEKRVHESRNEELEQVKNIFISETLLDVLWGSIPIFVTMISFWSYTQLEGKQLTASVAFASIAVFSELEFAMSVIPEFIAQYYEASISLRRIEKYLDSDEIERPFTLDPNEPIKVGFENATIGWSLTKSNSGFDQAENNTDVTCASDDDENFHFTLKDLNVHFPNNRLSLICGSTGCGKTLMMLSLLGETELIKGKVFCPRAPFPTVLDDNSAVTCIDVQAIPRYDTVITPSAWILSHAVAYASQTPWLQNASIKDNILFGLPLLDKRYKETLSVCALDMDLDFLEDGDETEIGEKGITLSGGQKARVALARAVYSRAQNVFMDDVLSAVDARTGQHLYQKCFMGPLMKNRTLVLITHNISLCLPGSAHVVFIKDGSIELQGSPTELAQAGQLEWIIQENEETPDDDDNTGIIDPPTEEIPKTNNDTDKKKPRVLIEVEGRASGMVKFRLYKKYLTLAGNWVFWTSLLLLAVFVKFTEVGATFWIKLWAQSYNEIETTGYTFNIMTQPMVKENQAPFDHLKIQSDLTMMKKEDKTMMYLMGYVAINLVAILFGGLRFAVTYWSGLKACRALYAELLHRIFRAPLRFFDTTPVGRIINRFSKDFEAIDSSVPVNLINFIIQWIQVLSVIAVSVYIVPISAIPMVIVVILNFYLGSSFVNASREIKRMESVSRSPLFILFSETIVGISTIRAFGMTREFLLKMMERVDGNSLPFYYSGVMTRWISIRISCTGAAISFITAMFVLFNLDKIDAATAGFCLMYVLSFTDKTFWGVRRYTDLEVSFNSIERVVEFMEIEEEPPAITEKRPTPNWPDQGAIEVIDLEARYAAELNPVLRGLNFTVKPKEKIGVVGRTGSGKSTLALSIFRFIELSRGKIIIDGIDISEIGTEDLRSNLTIIPQAKNNVDPVLFSGTLRSNMDPFNQFSDDDIFTTFHRVQLLSQKDIDQLSQNSSTQEESNKNVFKDLDTRVKEGGKNFSQGQRQLLCLARALLKRNQIVLMDEATANVSYEMDKAIQKTMTTEFKDSTVLCIAHRLNSVIDYDRILVMDHGLVAEFASPYELLQDENSIFYKMCYDSGEFDSLLAAAKEKHELLEI
ncbi:hypothetical protein K501DRAFT_330885 [Backusella circina FSU 941]|nr:hypothetical protein K501DRAFT_330885 [Backusella circina FSU 941]